MDKVLITGGQGFLGAWIARQLIAEGTSFVLLDLAPDDHILQQVLDPDACARIERVYGDVTDASCMRRIVGEVGATHVIHLAGLQVPTCRDDPPRGAHVNVMGTLNVFEAARAHPDLVRCVVYASSAAVAGPAEDYDAPYDDDAPHRPRTHYGVFKRAGEGSARIYWQDHGIPSVGLRPLCVYGVGREIGLTSGPTLAIRAAELGEAWSVPFTGPTGFNYAADVASIFVACARRHRSGALALNLPGEVHTVEAFIRCIEEIVPAAKGRLACEGSSLPLAYEARETGLERLLGTVPHTSICDGIRATVERFRALRNAGRL